MLHYDPRACLPSAAELPDSDDTPVDNELQNLIPNLLKAILGWIWAERTDWFFGVDMGIYYAAGEPPLVPDGFLSLGVERFVNGSEGRLSYVLWEENGIPPIFVLEVVSRTYGGEYERKKTDYAKLGILYYAIYVPSRRYRRNRPSLEIYRLVNGVYELQGEHLWMPEVGLALGKENGIHLGWEREWLYWYDSQGQRLPTPEELARVALQERERANRLAERLRALGVDPEELD
ncbi:MAG: Uma2 family endonuclease [Cyanobacteriota bacterium]